MTSNPVVDDRYTTPLRRLTEGRQRWRVMVETWHEKDEYRGRLLFRTEAVGATAAAAGGGVAGASSSRIAARGGHDEVRVLADASDRMLDRLEDAFARQRGFVADASHELRSPLTRMRTELEVDLAHRDRADPYATMAGGWGGRFVRAAPTRWRTTPPAATIIVPK